MQIAFTPKEYTALFDLMRLVDHMLANSEFEEPDLDINPYWKVIQKIYGSAEVFGFDNWVQFDPEHNWFSPVDEEKRDTAWPSILSAFMAKNWWEQLCIGLSIRDTIREIGKERFHNLPFEEQYGLIAEKAEQYNDEFAKHGVENIRVVGMDWGSGKR